MLHIDFGDCFEVAMQREKFPEKVPFRLTRMLVKVISTGGGEGRGGQGEGGEREEKQGSGGMDDALD